MKKYPLLLLFFGQLLLSTAQIEFAPPGATWHYEYVDYAPFAGLLFNGYEEWTYQRDTLLAGKTCKVLTGQRVGQIDGELEISGLPERIIYQDAAIIYSWYQDQFYKMYDFGVAKGDTITLAGGNSYIDSCSISFQVDSVYFAPINGVSLKNILLSPLNGTYASYGHINEKLGALPNFLFEPDLGCLLDLPRPFPFRCYQDNDFPLYQADTTSCDHFGNVSALISLEELGMSIDPNPVDHYFEIRNAESIPYDLFIFTVSGQLLHQQLGARAVQKTMDTSAWHPGIHWVLVKTNNGWAKKKLLKLP